MDEKEKLRVLLSHWIEHNQEHSEEFRQWAQKATDSGENKVGDDILAAVEKLEEASEFLNGALQKLG